MRYVGKSSTGGSVFKALDESDHRFAAVVAMYRHWMKTGSKEDHEKFVNTARKYAPALGVSSGDVMSAAMAAGNR